MSHSVPCSRLIAEALAGNHAADLALLVVSHPSLAAGPCGGILSERSILRLWHLANGAEPSALEAAIVRIVGEALLIEELQ